LKLRAASIFSEGLQPFVLLRGPNFNFGIGVYDPDGRETPRIGIVPDITVHSTVQGIRKGQDELLAKAIQVI
jgi:hypothetical protein